MTSPRPHHHLITSLTIGLLAVSATACGDTYIDNEATATTADSQPPETTIAIDVNADVDDLMGQMASLMKHLDEQIIDDENPEATLADIERLWATIEPRLANSREVFSVGQTVELAQTGVTHNRPADASKGYKLLNEIIKAYV